MKKKSFFPILIIVSIAACIGLWFALWVIDRETAGIIKLVLTLLLLPFMGCAVICAVGYYKSDIRFFENMVKISYEKIKKVIYYSEIKEVRYVMRNSQISKKEKGIPIQNIKNYRGCTPYYDIIGVNDELMATIDLMIWKERDIEEFFLMNGIKVYTKDGMKQPRRKRMTGEMLEKLLNNPMKSIDYQGIQTFVNETNQKIRLKNSNQFSVWKNIIVVGIFILAVYILSGFLSFLIIGVVCVLTGIIFGVKSKRFPYMQKENVYEAGWVYWGRDVGDFMLYFKEKRMERKDWQKGIVLQSAKVNELNYCVINNTLHMVVMSRDGN